jgi:CheY-like chemotaxis protein
MNKKPKLNCVLLIDDDEPTNYLSELVISASRCTKKIEIATSGEMALQYLTSAVENEPGETGYPKPDLILLDINMPAMNGWEFMEKYGSIDVEQKANVVIIMLTTSLNPDDRWKSGNIPHISGFENKPLTQEKLSRILEEFFPTVQQEARK